MSFGVLPSPQGGLTGALNRLLSQLFGWGKIVWPVVAFTVGVWLMVQSFGEKVIEIPYFRIIGVISLYLCALTWLQMLQSINHPAPTVEAFRPISYRLAVTDGGGGGWLGHEMYLLLLSQLLDWGTLSVLIAWLLMSMMLTFDVSIVELWGYVIGVFAVFRVNDEERARKRAAREALTKEIVTAMRPGEEVAKKTLAQKTQETDKAPSLVRTRVVGRAAPGSEVETTSPAAAAPILERAGSTPAPGQPSPRPGPVINRRAGAGNGDSGEETASTENKTGAAANAAALAPSPRRLPHMRRPGTEGGEEIEQKAPAEPVEAGDASRAAAVPETTGSDSAKRFGFLGRRGGKVVDQESAEIPADKAATDLEGPEEAAAPPQQARGTRLSPSARPPGRETGAGSVPGIPLPPRPDRSAIRDTVESQSMASSPLPPRPDRSAIRDTIEHQSTTSDPLRRPLRPGADRLPGEAGPGGNADTDTSEQAGDTGRSGRLGRFLPGLRRPSESTKDEPTADAVQASQEPDAASESKRFGRFLPGLRRSSESKDEPDQPAAETAKSAADALSMAGRIPGDRQKSDAGPGEMAATRGLNAPARSRTLAFDDAAARPDQPGERRSPDLAGRGRSDAPSAPLARRPVPAFATGPESPATDEDNENITPDRGKQPRLGAAAQPDLRQDEPPARDTLPSSGTGEPLRRQSAELEPRARPPMIGGTPRPPGQPPFNRPPAAKPSEVAAETDHEDAESEPQGDLSGGKPARPAIFNTGGRTEVPARPGVTPKPDQPAGSGEPARRAPGPSPLTPEAKTGEVPAAARPVEPLRSMPAAPLASQEKEKTDGEKPGETPTARAELPTRRAPAMPPAMLEEDDEDQEDFGEDFDDEDLYEEETEVDAHLPQRPSVTGRTLPFERPTTQRTPLIVHHPAPASQGTRPAASAIQSPSRRPPEPVTAAASGENAPTRMGGFSRSNLTYEVPDFRKLLRRGDEKRIKDEILLEKARVIEDTLMSFGAPGKVVEVNPGPVITQFGVEPDYVMGRSGRKMRVKVGAIARLDADLALALAARSIRIEAPVPGKGFVGIEVPNDEVALVGLYDIMESPEFTRIDSKLRIALGLAVDGTPVAADLTAMPHLLIAGTTGSGKSVCVNSIISCLLLQNTPEDVQFIMVDPKRVELTGYNGIPHLVAPVVVDLERIVGVLQWVQREMEERYRKFAAIAARNILDYNHKIGPDETRMPYYIVVVDELADLMMLAPDETERLLTRLAQMSRATGIHLIISTQRPSVDIITGLIKANFPARVAFAVASSVDSRVILDQPGAEKLLGRGDMLYQSPDAAAPLRMQGVFVSDEEIVRITRYWKGLLLQEADAKGERDALASPSRDLAFKPLDTSTPRPKSRPAQRPLWEDEGTGEDDESGLGEDELYDQAVELIQRLNKASISLLQRRLRIGYTRAARLIDRMEAEGIVGPAESGSKPREVLKGAPRQTSGDD
jgi:DNA segregation ATPase FtsK/SpoIIIE-like protein